MEKKTMGAFLAALRKANGMTQQNVADILNVSNKTVSKWERDEGCPEIMMLPAIAELYGVTVDEILRGERIINSENINTDKDIKTEKRAKYIFDKSVTKYTNYSIVSVALGAVAVIIACLAVNFSYDFSMLACIFAIILSAAGIIVEGIALNSFFSNIKSDSIEIDGATLDKAKKKAALWLSLTITFSVAVILCTVATFVFNSFFFTFISLAVGAALFAVIYSVVCQKLSVKHSELSPEFKKYRKKHIKVTAVIVVLTVVLSVAFPFVAAVFMQSVRNSFCFTGGVGYQYNTNEEAINDYWKIKNYFESGQKLYTFIYEYPTDNGWELTVDELQIEFTHDENGYQIISDVDYFYDESYTEIEFETYEQVEKYKYENVIDYDTILGSARKDIRFEDETYTILYGNNTNYFNIVEDILPIFILAAIILVAVETDVSLIMYFSKKKKENQGA